MTIRYLYLSTVAMALAACGGGGGGSSPKAITGMCNAELNVPKELCDCIGRESKALTPAERRFLVASLRQDEKATERARSDLDFTELTRAGTFMLTATQTCAASLPE